MPELFLVHAEHQPTHPNAVSNVHINRFGDSLSCGRRWHPDSPQHITPLLDDIVRQGPTLPLARMLPRVMGGLSNKIVGSQHHGSAGLGLLLEELTRCSLFN